MKTEQILEWVNRAIAEPYPKDTLTKLAAALQDQIRLEKASSSGQLAPTRIIGRVLKNADRKDLQYPWLWEVDGITYQCVCDGYQAYRFKEPYLPLPERPESAGEPINLARVWPKLWEYSQEPLPMPSVGEIKAEIAIQKAQFAAMPKIKGVDHPPFWHGPLWRFGDGKPTVLAEFLLNIASVFPDVTEIMWKDTISPLLCVSGAGDAILLPCRTAPANSNQEKE